jgi:hypothetical protein
MIIQSEEVIESVNLIPGDRVWWEKGIEDQREEDRGKHNEEVLNWSRKFVTIVLFPLSLSSCAAYNTMVRVASFPLPCIVLILLGFPSYASGGPFRPNVFAIRLMRASQVPWRHSRRRGTNMVVPWLQACDQGVFAHGTNKSQKFMFEIENQTLWYGKLDSPDLLILTTVRGTTDTR